MLRFPVEISTGVTLCVCVCVCACMLVYNTHKPNACYPVVMYARYELGNSYEYEHTISAINGSENYTWALFYYVSWPKKRVNTRGS
jgi:hypothetical protein